MILLLKMEEIFLLYYLYIGNVVGKKHLKEYIGIYQIFKLLILLILIKLVLIPILKKSKYELNVKIRKLKKYDIEFWESFGINEKWLNFGLIYPISHIFLHNDQVDYLFSADKYAYVYIEYKDNIPTFKIYQPYSNKTKWLNNHDKSVWDLWNKLPVEGDNLIITSSRKDALCIWANCNIPSTSLQAESYLPKQQVVKQLKERFKKYLCFI